MSVGRNEMCPCGSGKKYKRCCGIVTPMSQISSLREQKLRREYEKWLERMNQFALESAGVEGARKQFVAETGISEEEAQHPQWTIHFVNWFMFDYRTDGLTVFERFVQQEGRRMDRDLRQAFERLMIGIYQLEGIDGETLILRDLVDGQTVYAIHAVHTPMQQGNILIGRLLHFGVRRLLHPGSIMLPANTASAIQQWLQSQGITESQRGKLRDLTTQVYRFIIHLNSRGPVAHQQLVQRTYPLKSREELLQRVHNNRSFELKKRSSQEQIWVYTAGTEEFLFAELNGALLSLHEVLGEIIITQDQVVLESFATHIDQLADTLGLTSATDRPIQQLTSTGLPLTRGTIFISSQPELPDELLNWAVQTYFAENWLVTPQKELDDTAPLVAAARGQQQRSQLLRAVEKLEESARLGVGPGRFMHLEMIRPRLALPNEAIDIHNLLHRPLINGGFPNSSGLSDTLAVIARFVAEVTEGKSEATVKKYDEVMSLFRAFLRDAFGSGFEWNHLRTEELAFFLVHDLLRRIDSPTKTTATHVITVLSAFFRWLDREMGSQLAPRMLPLLSALRDDLPEAYRMRALLAKEAASRLSQPGQALLQVEKEHLLLMERTASGWKVKRSNGETIHWETTEADLDSLAPDWMMVGVIGQTSSEKWHLLGVPELYPPVVAELLGVHSSLLV